MATQVAGVKEIVFEWEGRDRHGKLVRGETRAGGENQVQVMLRRRGIFATRVRKRRLRAGHAIKPRHVAILTRQLATMLKAGVPLLQAFDVVGRGNPNPGLARLLNEIRADVETGSPLSVALRKHPAHFSRLYCNLVETGETAGMLDTLLERLASHMEKTEALKAKIRSALMYPTAVILVALAVVSVIMLFVIPAFKEVFSAFGAELPAPTLFVIAASEFFVRWWWLMLGALIAGVCLLVQSWKRSDRVRLLTDRLLLGLPVFGELVRKSVVARWTRSLATMFAAGVPLVESLDSVGNAAGNMLYSQATKRIRQDVATGTSLAAAMTDTRIFPGMVTQMTAIGEESGALDHLLGKAADFYEAEVDEMVAGLSSLMEPIIIVVLGIIIGGIVVAMYLPIFKLGQVV